MMNATVTTQPSVSRKSASASQPARAASSQPATPEGTASGDLFSRTGTFQFDLKVDDFGPKKAVVLSDGEVVATQQYRDPQLLGRLNRPAEIAEDGLGSTGELKLREASAMDLMREQWPGSEVRTLVNQGPSENRIDLTIVGDGYTEADKEKFFEDARKIAEDLFGDETFSTYLPLFNLHAVYVPSNEQGIGDGRPKDTALGLYRHGNIRQAVMPGDRRAANKATRLAPDTDFPILLGNDEIYGGLGGAYAITTASQFNLTTVLRHELGHNFGDVGEEYDGGQVYSGANASRTTRVPWKHWVEGSETPIHTPDLLHLSAPWKNLSRGDWNKTINVPSDSDRVVINFSSTGFDSAEDVELLVDGKPVKFDGKFNYDRNFYNVTLQLPPGTHTVTFRERVPDGNNVLSKVNIYSMDASYPKDSKAVGAFGSFNQRGSRSGYRPTHDDCLMRDMSKRTFCVVCVENMWRRFLKQVSLVDTVERKDDQIQASLIPLGAERLEVQWVDPSGRVREDLSGKTQWKPGPGDRGRWKLQVKFVSPEVKDPDQEDWTVHTVGFEVA